MWLNKSDEPQKISKYKIYIRGYSRLSTAPYSNSNQEKTNRQ
jgi:hypothetical protein